MTEKALGLIPFIHGVLVFSLPYSGIFELITFFNGIAEICYNVYFLLLYCEFPQVFLILTVPIDKC